MYRYMAWRNTKGGLVWWLNKLFNPRHSWTDYTDRFGNDSVSITDDNGGLLGNLFNKYTGAGLTDAEQEANAFSAEEAQKSRDFTEYMTRNKYQMETQSMQEAGLNPAMMYGGGNLVSTSSNGAAASSVAPEMGNLVDMIMALVRFPKELDNLRAEVEERKSQAQLNRDLGNAALQNAGTNARNAGTQERMASVAELEVDIKKHLADSEIEVNDEQKRQIAENAKYIAEQTRLLVPQLEVAKRNAASAEKQAAASLQNAMANVQRAATDNYVASYQTDVMYSEAILKWYEGEGKQIINRYLDDKQKAELENLLKEGIHLDKENNLLDKQGHLVTAQTITQYTNAACNVSNAVNRWVNPLSSIGKDASAPINPTSFVPEMPYYGTFYEP